MSIKITKETLPIFADHWGIVAISTGTGYVLLSGLNTFFRIEIATPVAWVLIVAGFIVRQFLAHRRKKANERISAEHSN
jgi:hypothetical protein